MHKASWMSWLAVVTYISLACSGCSGGDNAETGGTGGGNSGGGTSSGGLGGSDGGTTGTGTMSTTTDTSSEPDMCGDIVAASHPPFKAIERLATTSDEVRILVYGQSISEQTWWSKTKTWLQEQYPSSNLVMEEHARGGCSAACLVGHEPWFVDNLQYNRLAEDVFSWKPDLVIFHVYGDHVDYGYIMKALTQGCAGFDNYMTWDSMDVPEVHCTPEQESMSSGYTPPEVLVQSDHRWAGNYPKTCPADPGPQDWDCFMNLKVIPGHVEEWGYTLQDNWNLWAQAIESENIDPLTLTNGPDDVHLSEAGNDMMFRMTAPHLCYKP